MKIEICLSGKQDVMSLKRNEINCIRSILIRSKYFKQICCAVILGKLHALKMVGENNKGEKRYCHRGQELHGKRGTNSYRPNQRDRGSAYSSWVGLN